MLYSLYSHAWPSFRRRQGRKGVMITTVELTDMTDSNSKEEQEEIEEQDTVTAVDNICYERVPSKFNTWHQVKVDYIQFMSNVRRG